MKHAAAHTFLVLLLLTGLGSASAQSFLSYSDEGWDFGRREQTDTDSKVIKVTNRGPATVQIKKLEMTCGCVAAKFSKMAIAPGETVELKLQLHANRGEGEIKKFAIVHSDDPGAPTKKLPMTGFIRPIWTLDVKGRILDFGEVNSGEASTKRVTLRVRPEFKIDLVEVLSQPAGETLKVKSTPFKEKDGHYGWHLDLTLGDQAATGSFEGVVRVETDFAKFRFRGFRVLAQVKSTTTLTPATLRLGTLKPGVPWKGEILVSKKSGGGLRIASTSCADPRVKLTTETVKEGNSYRICVSITPAGSDKEVRGRITISVDEPGSRTFTVSYRGRVQSD